MKKSYSACGLFFGLTTIALLLFSCGGGGGGGGDGGGSDLTPASIDSEALAQSTAMALGAGELVDLNQTFSPLSVPGEPADRLDVAARVLREVMPRLLRQSEAYQSAGSGREADGCANGGSVAMDATWDGPDNAQDCSQLVNLNANLIFNACAEGDLYAHGRVRLRFTGNACEPAAMKMEFANLTIEDNAAGMSAEIQNLEMNFTNITWANGEIRRMTVTLNGDVSGIMNRAAYKAQYKNYRMALILSNSGDTMQVTVSGSLTGACLDGWVTLTTIEPIVIPVYEECPISGVLRISGNDSGTVTFEDPGVTVNFKNQITHYAVCADLPDCTD
jgi:hypothetical protein